MNESIVMNLANYVREVIENNKNYQGDSYMNMTKFPLGCCDMSSWILWKYLCEHGIDDFQFSHVYGTYRHKTYNHVWLENSTYVLDITGDQFNGWWKNIYFERVIFKKKENYFFSPNRHEERNHHQREMGTYEGVENYFLDPQDNQFDIHKFYDKFFLLKSRYQPILLNSRLGAPTQNHF